MEEVYRISDKFYRTIKEINPISYKAHNEHFRLASHRAYVQIEIAMSLAGQFVKILATGILKHPQIKFRHNS